MKYAKTDSLTRVYLTRDPIFVGNDLFFSSEVDYDPSNPPLFPSWGGLYGIRHSDRSVRNWLVNHSVICREEIEEYDQEIKQEAIEESKAYIDQAITDLDIPAD